MTIVALEYDNTPVELPPPPRQVMGGPGAGIWFARVFTLPHALVGIGSIGGIIVLVLWRFFGVDGAGFVTGGRTEVHKGKTSYLLDFAYDAGGSTLADSSPVSKATYDTLIAARGRKTPVEVNHFELGPIHVARLPNLELRDKTAPLFLVCWALGWNLVLALILHAVWIKPVVRKRLYRFGCAIRGTVISKRVMRGRSKTYYVSYSFTVPPRVQPTSGPDATAAGEALSAEMTTSCQKWHEAAAGQEVTVLYWPGKPRRSVVYELGGYRLAPSPLAAR